MNCLKTFLYFVVTIIVQTMGQSDTILQLEGYSPNYLPLKNDLGNLAMTTETVLSSFINISSPNATSCTPFVIYNGPMELVVIMKPFGNCAHCCPIDDLSNHITLYFTNKNRNGTFEKTNLSKKAGLFKSYGFRRDLPAIIFIHGFTSLAKGASSRAIVEAYLNRDEDCNIILVEWKDLAAGPWYVRAASNTKLVGRALADTLKFYNKTGELDLSKVHLVGFSLGAHVAGFTGKFINGKNKIGRITGLDPAFPLFSMTDRSNRLSKYDAEYVDVIHTNGGWFGFPVSLGHADFYPNSGGIVQPGCQATNPRRHQLAGIPDICSHFFSCLYYAESVRNPRAFPVMKCSRTSKRSASDCQFVRGRYMGLFANKSLLGDFHLVTNDQEPFSESIEEQRSRIKKQIKLP